MTASHEQLVDLYRTMLRIRLFEEKAGWLMETGTIPGGVHLSIGQEAVAAGVMLNLRVDDQITSTHRGHGHLLAKGADLSAAFAELLGREDGLCKGRGGTMHVADVRVGMLGANGIVAAGIPIAVGAAFANRYKKSDAVTCAFFGDGAAAEGAFHEGVNLAAVLNLPIVFVCENNGYGEYTAQAQQHKLPDIADRAGGYGIPSEIGDGMDVTSVSDLAAAAIQRARADGGPTLLEFKTYRFADHVGASGMGVAYRDDAEVAQWRQRDPLPRLAQTLRAEAVLSDDEIDAVAAEVRAQIESALEQALASPLPDPSDLLRDVYVDARQAAV